MLNNAMQLDISGMHQLQKMEHQKVNGKVKSSLSVKNLVIKKKRLHHEIQLFIIYLLSI